MCFQSPLAISHNSERTYAKSHAFAPHDARDSGHGLCPDAARPGSGTGPANNSAQRSVHSRHRASAGAVKDLAGGHVSAMFLPIHTALPLAESGNIRYPGRRQPNAGVAGGAGADAGRTRRHRFRRRFLVWRSCSGRYTKDIVDRYNTVFNEILARPGRSGSSRQARSGRSRRPARTAGSADRQGPPALGQSRQGRRDQCGIGRAAGETKPSAYRFTSND
jgi:hypothetical protein